jgi:uncharacterized membrane protein
MSRFLSRLDHTRIAGAIAQAEQKTSGQIRVHVTHRKPDDFEARARRRFELLGMTATKNRNGVLIYIAPRIRRFRILGDVGVHEKCGDEFWKTTADAIEAHFRKGEFTDGIVAGVERAGTALAVHFPKEAGAENELPDEVTED